MLAFAEPPARLSSPAFRCSPAVIASTSNYTVLSDLQVHLHQGMQSHIKTPRRAVQLARLTSCLRPPKCPGTKQ